jgi:translation initiation factor IF-3
MFLYLAPKKAGVAKKSQQKMDREKREAEANAMNASQNEKNGKVAEHSGDGLAANAKGLEALAALKFDDNE